MITSAQRTTMYDFTDYAINTRVHVGDIDLLAQQHNICTVQRKLSSALTLLVLLSLLLFIIIIIIAVIIKFVQPTR